MSHDRDVQAFHDRALSYEHGWRGRMHSDICNRTLDVAIAVKGSPNHVLDVGCGTGLLLRNLAHRLGDNAEELIGVDAAEAMVATAMELADDSRIRFSLARAEQLPFPDGHFDLVVSTTSFDHWSDQGQGLRECARVLANDGRLVLTDLFSPWLFPTLLFSHRGRARTRRRARPLLEAAGFRTVVWRQAYQLIIATAVASK